MEIKKNTVIKHPEVGVLTLQEIQDDVDAAKNKFSCIDFCFTYNTVQALINKVVELQQYISDKNHHII